MKARKATSADSRAIAELTVQLGYSANVTEISERLTKILPRDDCAVYVAEDDTGTIVGWIQAHASYVLESGFRVEIVGLVVAEEARRRGVGRILVRCAEEWAGERGVDVILVRSDTKRSESHLFYLSLNYQPTKTLQVYRKKIVR